MEVINDTPFMLAPLSGRIGFPGHSLTLIVKGTFELVPDGRCRPAQEQSFPTGDQLYPDDSEGTGSLRYEFDYAYFKPRTDMMLVGCCHSPTGQPIPACQATFRVGRFSKTLRVFGNRLRKGLLAGTSDPEPFTQIDLRYENSYGGPGYDPNPVGKGYGRNPEPGKRPLPNIEGLKKSIDFPGRRPEPAGFGPLARTWKPRASKLGHYGGGWAKERWPWFPDDFDWSYFNAAPADMQAHPYLGGDEELYFENLHAAIPQYRSQLPGIRVRAFLETTDPQDSRARDTFREVALNLDTLWVDMPAGQLVLVWRGVAAVASEDYEEVRHLFLTAEDMPQAPQTLDQCRSLFQARLAEREKMYELETIEPQETMPDSTPMQQVENELQQAQHQMRAALADMGIDPDQPPAEPDEDSQQMAAGMLECMGMTIDAGPGLLTRERIQEAVRQKESLAGLDLTGLDLSTLDMRGIDFTGAILRGVNFTGAKLSQSDFSSADLSNACLVRTVLQHARFKDADLTAADLTHADLRQADLQEAVVEEAVLKNTRLDECILNGANFSRSDLTAAVFKRASCREADFSNSRLTRADFTEADLSQVCLENAVALAVDMSDADLSGVRASGQTDLSMGKFVRIAAAYSIWENAVLNGADFSFARMEGANLAAASLLEADFRGAELKYARLSKSVLCQARCVSMNLFQGSLEKADLTETDFRGSNLYGAQLLDAVIHGTLLDGANTLMTKLAK